MIHQQQSNGDFKSFLAMLQSPEGRRQFQEQGTVGLNVHSGFVFEAHNAKLQWPECYSLFSRIRRSDPEISMVRVIYEALARHAEIDVIVPEDANDDELAARDFYMSEMENMEGGIEAWLEALVNYVPFLGWAWWSVVPGIRSHDWRPPDDDDWRSEADDGLIGIRRLGWRDHSSFFRWDIPDETGRLRGMEQLDYPNENIVLPLDQSLHVTFGDRHNPEGLGTLEAVWRLERMKYGLETIQSIGFEHSAGLLQVITDRAELSEADKAYVRAAARAMMSAQQGNFGLWPKGMRGEIEESPFTAAPAILEAIRYYGLLKLQLHNMQWISIATTAGTGAYAAMSDSSSMAMLTYNAMMRGFVQQYDQQVGKRLWEWNRDRFPTARERPQYVYKPMSKIVGLGELGQFLAAIGPIIPLGREDILAIRQKSGVLPEVLVQDQGEQGIEPEVPEEPGVPEMPEEFSYGDHELRKMVQKSMDYLDGELGLSEETDAFGTG